MERAIVTKESQYNNHSFQLHTFSQFVYKNRKKALLHKNIPMSFDRSQSWGVFTHIT